METPPSEHRFRIGELSRRVGLSDHVLRAWETRYSLFQPTRSAGGFRLYSREDERRARHMVRLLEEGMSAAEAAAVAQQAADLPPAPLPGVPDVPLRTDPPERSPDAARTFPSALALLDALAGFDEGAAHAILDRLLADRSVTATLGEVVLPTLAEIGRGWEQGKLNVAQEHFASNVIRGRLLGLARGWGMGHGPRAILACAPGEQHDLPLLAFGIVLRQHGWRISYLGADTPFADIALAADALPSTLVVLSATVTDSLAWPSRELTAVAARTRLVLAGPAATSQAADAVGAIRLRGDPLTVAILLDQQFGTDVDAVPANS